MLRGMAFPAAAYAFHAVKLLLLVAGWMFFCSFTPGLGSPWTIREWMFADVAFQKAFLWGVFFEAAGFGCMSGPLGLKIWPPVTASLHYLRPGTIKLPSFPGAPIIGGTTRTWLDVVLYAGLLLALVRALVTPVPTTTHFAPIVVSFVLLGLVDRVVLLTARIEHHGAMIVCFLLAGNWIAACKWVQLSIWFWAGVSKLTPAFSYVVPIMTANNPLLKMQAIRRRLFRSFPDDLRPSLLAKAMAHAGTFLEFAAPLTLLFVTQDGTLLWVGMAFVFLLHGFILSNLPIAAVFEWNVLSIYAACFLFWTHPTVSLFDVGSLPLVVYLLIGCLVLPALGNVRPSAVSFLIAMRYYAGNWAWNAWLFRQGSHRKLSVLKRVAPLLHEQQQRFLPADEAAAADAGFLAFRSMHLQGRMLGLLLPLATDGRPFADYLYADGETVAGSVLGWNFGEGHLADERLVAAIQAKCGFEDGDVRVIAVEAQPIFGSALAWRIVDAKRGVIAEGSTELAELAARNPWDLGEAPRRG